MQAVLALKRPEPRAGVLEIEPYVRTLFAAPRRRQFLFIGDGALQTTPVATPTFGVRADDHFVTVSAPITLWAQILFVRLITIAPIWKGPADVSEELNMNATLLTDDTRSN